MTRFSLAHALVAAPADPRPVLGQLDIAAALHPQMLPSVVILLFICLFDTMGTLVAVTEKGGLVNPDGSIYRGRQAFVSDASGIVAGAALGTSTITSYIESSAGIAQGGRTGLVAVVAGLCFLAALFFGPVVQMVGSYNPITAPALVVVGSMMLESVRRIRLDDPTEALPAFLIILGIPLTYSIADGIALGFISYPATKLLAGRGREVSPLIYGLAAILVLYFALLRAV